MYIYIFGVGCVNVQRNINHMKSESATHLCMNKFTMLDHARATSNGSAVCVCA